MAPRKTAPPKTAPADIAQPLERLTRLLRASEHTSDLNPAQWEALRYIARANRFSNSPIALAQFLGATKGTISQTVKALERKAYVIKTPRPDEKRSVSLSLTEKARQALKADPVLATLADLSAVPEKKKRRLAKGLKTLLSALLTQSHQPSFGPCRTCQHFVKDTFTEEIRSSPRFECRHYKAVLEKLELELMCQAHQPRNKQV